MYTVKWLPVEGKIKTGDWFHSEDSGLIFQEKQTKGKHINPRCKKVKLSLCSRDIKVGDKFIYIDGYEYVYQEEDFTEEAVALGYKVIGEISPDAYSYVTEGMELTEKEWFQNENTSYLLIKCPTCGTFH